MHLYTWNKLQVLICLLVYVKTIRFYFFQFHYWQIGELRRELESVRKHRKQYRNRRLSVPVPVVSLVGTYKWFIKALYFVTHFLWFKLNCKISGWIHKCWKEYTFESLDWSWSSCRGSVICNIRSNYKKGPGKDWTNFLFEQTTYPNI